MGVPAAGGTKEAPVETEATPLGRRCLVVPPGETIFTPPREEMGEVAMADVGTVATVGAAAPVAVGEASETDAPSADEEEVAVAEGDEEGGGVKLRSSFLAVPVPPPPPPLPCVADAAAAAAILCIAWLIFRGLTGTGTLGSWGILETAAVLLDTPLGTVPSNS